jgi:hypothetical protein
MVMKMLKTFTAIIDRQKDIERLQEMKDYIDARIRALESQRTDDWKKPSGREVVTSVTYRLEKVRCGKKGCKKCPHGPYWYAYWKENGKTKSKYIGKTLKIKE